MKQVNLICDVTSVKIPQEEIGGGKFTNPEYGAIVALNDAYEGDHDAINTEIGRSCFCISKELMWKTFKFWKTLPEYKPTNEMLMIVGDTDSLYNVIGQELGHDIVEFKEDVEFDTNEDLYEVLTGISAEYELDLNY